MSNPFENRALSISGPATDLVPVAPNDSADMPQIAVALFVETGGDVAFTSVAGNARVVRVADFSILPVGARRVSVTGTTATGIHALVV